MNMIRWNRIYLYKVITTTESILYFNAKKNLIVKLCKNEKSRFYLTTFSLCTWSQQWQNTSFHRIRDWKLCVLQFGDTYLDWTCSRVFPAYCTVHLLFQHFHWFTHTEPSSFSVCVWDNYPVFRQIKCLICPYPAVETPDNLPFPDGKEVSPEIVVETLPGTCFYLNMLS